MNSKAFNPNHLRCFNFRNKDKDRSKKSFVRIFSLLKKGEGFTLVELLLYIGLISLILFIVINFSWQVIYGNIKLQADREVRHNGWFALEKITKEIKLNNNPESFYLAEGVLYKDGIPLTTDQIKVADFKISSLANSYSIKLSLEYKNPGKRKEYESKINIKTTISLLEQEPPPEGCWGTGGICDSSCRHLNYGSLNNYYVDPGCAGDCLPAGYFYLNPSGSCSNDGTGVCYKMAQTSLEREIVCLQGAGCDFQCSGTCTPCSSFLNRDDCLQQQPCTWRGNRCRGRCTACGSFINQDSCQNQSGCSWNAIAWYWNLQNLQEGYPSYINCEWYVKN